MSFELIGIVFYLILMVAIGAHVSSKVKNDDDYFLASRTLGYNLTVFSLFATWFGAESCIGTSGKVFREGMMGAHSDPLTYSLCLFFMGLFFSKILWNHKITTLPELFRHKYSQRVEIVATWIMLPASLLWAGAQIRAFGEILHASLGIDPFGATLASLLVIIIYTTFGGLLADSYTDFIQGVAIIVGLFLLFYIITQTSGGLSNTFDIIKRESLIIKPSELISSSWMGRIEILFVPLLGSLMSQELVTRVSAARSATVAYRSSMIAGTLYLLVGCLPVIFGLLASHYIPDLVQTDSALPLLAKKFMPRFFYIIFIGALISATLSTVDTTLLTTSALLSHNIFKKKHQSLGPKGKLILARVCTILSALIAWIFSQSTHSVSHLVEMASGLGGPIILVMTIFALYGSAHNESAAFFTLIFSVILWILARTVVPIDSPAVLTTLFCAGCYLGLSLVLDKSRLGKLISRFKG